MGVPAELTTAPDFVQVRLALMRYLGGALEAVVFTRIQYRTQDDSRAWIEHEGRRWWTVTIPDLATDLGATEKQIRRVLDVLTERGALTRRHLNERGPYDRRMSYSPVILDMPSRADGAPLRADVDAPSGADLPPQQELEEREPSLFCDKHPSGTDEPCGPCGTARLRNQQWRTARAAKPTTLPRLEDTPMCPEHPGYPIDPITHSCARHDRDREDRSEAA